MTALEQAALDYAARGLPVFPCGASKAPLVSGGFKSATCDPETIRRWWSRWPDALIGMPTGSASGVAVLDLDVKNGKDGLAEVPDWEKLSPVIARTRSGGAHVYFRSDREIRCSADQIAHGVDTRGEGGYVIVPPSPGYKWDNGSDFSDLPPWPEGLRPPQRSAERTPGATPTADPALVAAALAAIPNYDLGWDDWNGIGMATWRATGGSEEGCSAFDGFSAKSQKYDATATRERWEHYSSSPPTEIGAGTLLHLADEAMPGWRAKAAIGEAHHAGPLIQTSAEFTAGFVPPDYLIDGLLQTRFLYSMTAPTGSGKTCIAMRIAAHIAFGLSLAGRDVEKGKVLFFAGENPDDVRMRWIKLCEEMQIDPSTDCVFWRAGGLRLSDKELRRRIAAETAAYGPFALIVVDTSAAFFEGDDENSNTQMGAHARTLRSLVGVAGSPTIIVTCHPTKNPNMDNLVPRGGGAFLAEVDGNLCCVKQSDNTIVQLHWHGKFRGPDFPPIPFKITPGTTDLLKDRKGRHIFTVTAEPITDQEQAAAEDTARNRQDELMAVMREKTGLSQNDLAREAGWSYSNGEPNKTLVYRTLQALKAAGLVEKKRERWELTKNGQKVAPSSNRPSSGPDEELPF